MMNASLSKTTIRHGMFIFVTFALSVTALVIVMFIRTVSEIDALQETPVYKTRQALLSEGEKPLSPDVSPYVPLVASKDDMANWKTYRNEKYGFEVKYPVNFSLKSGHDAGATALAESIEIYNLKIGVPTEGKIMPVYNFVLYINPPSERVMDPKRTRNGGFPSPQDFAKEGGYTLSTVIIGENTFLKDSNSDSYHFKDSKTAGYFDLNFSFSDREELKNSPSFIGLEEQHVILEHMLSSLKIFN